ncbi:MAG: hypothetical protein R3257_06785 [bacterium]|nr:hypothetical protein [bacterium]
MKKRWIIGLGCLVVSMGWMGQPHAAGETPVFSANGFLCGKKGLTVTCKGPIPGRSDTVTGTGHDIVYLTVNTRTAGAPARYTYFSDTGCLIGYTFNAAGNPLAAVASHRSGAKKNFKFTEQNYDALIEFCASQQDGPPQSKQETAAK